MGEPSLIASTTRADQLARAVLLFFSPDAWGDDKAREWRLLTGRADCTSRVLCDLAREGRVEEARR